MAPARGSLTREIWYDPDTYGKAGAAICDYLGTRQEIDLLKVGLNGVSFGSYWCTQVVASEPRFAACGICLVDRLAGKPATSQYIEVDQTGQVHVSDWGAERNYEYGITASTKKMIFG